VRISYTLRLPLTEPPVNDLDGWDNPAPPPTRRVTRRRGARNSSSSIGGVNVGTILTQVGSQNRFLASFAAIIIETQYCVALHR
jgi:hypothetical protein